MSVKIITFDFDGTLRPDILDGVLTFNIRKQVMLEFLQKEDIKTKDMYEAYEALPADKQKEINSIGNKLILEKSEIPETVIGVLRELSKKYKLVIISVGKKTRVRTILEQHNILDLFSTIYSVKDDFGESLKNSDIFKKIAQDFGVAPSECLHIGDLYEADHLPPKEAGFQTLLVEHSPIKKIAFKDILTHLKNNE